MLSFSLGSVSSLFRRGGHFFMVYSVDEFFNGIFGALGFSTWNIWLDFESYLSDLHPDLRIFFTFI